MFEVYVLTKKNKSAMMKVGGYLLTLSSAIFLALTLLGVIMFAPIAIALIAASVVVNRRYIEYEYSFFDDEVRFAKIINKNKRKVLKGYNMSEVVIIAPAGDQSLYQYENDNGAKVRDLSSGDKDAKVYVMVAKGQERMEMVRFEPDEKYLDAVCRRFGMKVKR